MTNRPNLFLVGAPRSGTTALTHQLAEHPEIFMAEKKEMHYFGTDLKINVPFRDRKTYEEAFSDAPIDGVVGEASVFYLYSKVAAQEIHDYNSAAKIIMLLRNPIDMVTSLHAQQLKNGHECITDLSDAIDAEEVRRQDKAESPSSVFPVECFFYTTIARYASQLQRYRERFDANQLHVIIHDDYVRDNASIYRNVLSFLGVDDAYSASFERINATREEVRSRKLNQLIYNTPRPLKKLYRALPSAIKGKGIGSRLLKLNRVERAPTVTAGPVARRLKEIYRPDVEKLSAILDRDLRCWLAD